MSACATGPIGRDQCALVRVSRKSIRFARPGRGDLVTDADGGAIIPDAGARLLGVTERRSSWSTGSGHASRFPGLIGVSRFRQTITRLGRLLASFSPLGFVSQS